MIKTYKLTTPARNSSIVLRGKSNNTLRYDFSGGDPLTGKPATIMLHGQYSQDLLEESDLFKKGYVKLVKVDNGGEQVSSPASSIAVEEVTSPEQLLEYVAVNLDKIYKNPKAAIDYATKSGYTFPNLNME